MTTHSQAHAQKMLPTAVTVNPVDGHDGGAVREVRAHHLALRDAPHAHHTVAER